MAEIESQVTTVTTQTRVPLPPPTATNPNPGATPAPPQPPPPISANPTALEKVAPAPPSTLPPAPAPSIIAVDKISLNFTVKTFKPDGSSESITIPLPDSPDFEQWTFAQQVGMLKNGMWEKESLQSIIFGLAYAKHIGAEVLEGELFPTGGGRWGTSNKYKIKKGFATQKILGYSTETREMDQPLPDSIAAKCVQKKDLECTVTLEVKGLNKPIVRKARLSRWFTAANPNWSSRPEHMLELNTLAHAMEFLVPGETDEAPPISATGEGMGSPVSSVPSIGELRAAQRASLPPPPPPSPSSAMPKGQTLEVGLPDPTEIDSILADLPQTEPQTEQQKPELVKS